VVFSCTADANCLFLAIGGTTAPQHRQ